MFFKTLKTDYGWLTVWDFFLIFFLQTLFLTLLLTIWSSSESLHLSFREFLRGTMTGRRLSLIDQFLVEIWLQSLLVAVSYSKPIQGLQRAQFCWQQNKIWKLTAYVLLLQTICSVFSQLAITERASNLFVCCVSGSLTSLSPWWWCWSKKPVCYFYY